MESMNEPVTSLSLDDIFEILSDRNRRRVLVDVLDHDASTALDVGDWDAADQGVMLRHDHLPKLEEAGFIEWDREEDAVREGPMFDEIRPLLQLLSDHTDELPGDWP